MNDARKQRRSFLKTTATGLAGILGASADDDVTALARDEASSALQPNAESKRIFVVPEALFRSTATGCTLHWETRDPIEARILVGGNPGRLKSIWRRTSTGSITVPITDLRADAPSYVQLQFRKPGTNPWSLRPLRRIHTARESGKVFRIALLADSHIYYSIKSRQSVRNLNKTVSAVLRDEPDFVIFLGDEAGIRYRADKPGAMNQDLAMQRWQLWRHAFAPLLAAVPSYLVLGNHEGEAGYYQNYPLGGQVKHYQRWGTIARKRYCLNPLPDTYPEGGENEPWQGNPNAALKAGDVQGERSPLQNYYAWTWGDALYVVLDVHRYTNVNGKKPNAVEQWSLGSAQMKWLDATLRASRATWKFVIAHHLVGGSAWSLNGKTRKTDYVYGRGGARYARVGRQARVTELMKETGATFFLYGHDHVFAHQQAEGIHFVCCGRPTYLNASWWNTPGWKEAYGNSDKRDPHDFIGAIGYTRLTISPREVMAEYVRTGTNDPPVENVTKPEGATLYRFRAEKPA